MIGTDVEGFLNHRIADQLDAKGAGLGDYTSKFQLAAERCRSQCAGPTDQEKTSPTQSNSSFSITQLFLSLISKTFE